MGFITLSPAYEASADSATLAPRLLSLSGKTVGLLDNNKKGVGHLLGSVEEILYTEDSVRTVVRRVKSNASRPAPDETLRDLASCDAVITGVGD